MLLFFLPNAKRLVALAVLYVAFVSPRMWADIVTYTAESVDIVFDFMLSNEGMQLSAAEPRLCADQGGSRGAAGRVTASI
jgi:hypothetical protein